ncbi:hypothetical protein E2C01_081961 [Portunus trituberculatus]|uniref:Uncharacterized protein n=1 Tax=Portunus trituberculatus TaxID=210409 RepID=A0A5B7IR50_PORTR|nr:hypothetical protein [Portunus trituberculatus]
MRAFGICRSQDSISSQLLPPPPRTNFPEAVTEEEKCPTDKEYITYLCNRKSVRQVDNKV